MTLVTGPGLHAQYVDLARTLGVSEGSINPDWDKLTPEQREAWHDHALDIAMQDDPERTHDDA